MQLLDDDMDELFRKAASQYPLKTDGSDWDAVMRRLPQSDNKEASSINRLRGSRWLKWLFGPLLALLVLLIGMPALRMGVLPPKEGSGASVAKTVVTTAMVENDNNNSNVIPVITGTNSNKGVPVDENVVENNTIATPVSEDRNNNTAVTEVINTDKSKNTPVVLINTNNNSSSISPGNNPLNLHWLQGIDQKDLQISAQLQTNSGNIKLRPDTIVPKAKTKVQKGLYIGIVASPDFSTVKGQRISNVGYNAGLIAGYRISRHLAVETGVLLERKYYYSEGRYFSTKKIDIPANMKVIDVDGWCKMIEIPLNVRYAFSIKEKSNWYVNGGVSSYIMSKESYDYKYKYYNMISTKNWSYNNATRNWFSIIHVGVGYEHRVGAKSTLRVEPYLKIPAGGVGIGSLPMTSVGLNVGITRPIRF